MPMALPPTQDELAAELKVFIPKVGRWKHDVACGICGAEFNYLRGRHHCRYCGASVCGKHSKNRAVVPSSMSTEKQRVCDECFPKCQYGIPLQRRRGMTTAGSSRGITFTLLEPDDMNDPRQIRSARGRAQTTVRQPNPLSPRNSRQPKPERARALTTIRARSRSRSNSPNSRFQNGGNADAWKKRWQDNDNRDDAAQNVARRRGMSQPHQRRGFKPLPPSPPSSPPPSPRKPQTMTPTGNVSRMSPKRKMGSPDFEPKKQKSTKTLSIRKHYGATPPPPPKKTLFMDELESEPPNPKTLSIRKQFGASPSPPAPQKTFSIPTAQPLDDSFAVPDFGASVMSVRDSNDAIALQYLSSFIKQENVTKLETSHVTVSHERIEPMTAMAQVVEMKPDSPQQLHISSPVVSKVPDEPPLLSVTANNSERAAENRRASNSSTGTVSISDSEELDKPQSSSEWDVDNNNEELKSHPTVPAPVLTVEVDIDSASSTGSSSGSVSDDLQVVEIPEPVQAKPKPSGKLRASVTFAQDTKPPEPEVSVEELELLRQVMELEKQIHEYQCELPALIEEWRRVELIASRLRADARESREKLLHYQRARAVVTRAIRMASKWREEKEYDTAILELSRAAAIECTNPKVWYLLADFRMHVGQLAEAEEACRVSVELQASAVAISLLGRILHLLGRHDEAIQCYLTALGRKTEVAI